MTNKKEKVMTVPNDKLRRPIHEIHEINWVLSTHRNVRLFCNIILLSPTKRLGLCAEAIIS